MTRPNERAAPTTGELRYLEPGSPRPITRMGSGDDESNCTGRYAARPTPIYDARAMDPTAVLDRHGFELREHHSAATDLYHEEQITGIYYPEMERLLMHAIGAHRVHVFDHNTRAEGEASAGRPNVHAPVNLVHNDFTAQSGPERLLRVLPDEGEALLQYRFSIVNLWRPIRGPLESAPIAVCDANTIRAADLVTADLVYPERTGHEYRSTFNPDHIWYYYPRMQRQEVLLLKVYDSAEGGTARFGLHTAFNDPATPPAARPRESIEVRAMAFYR